MSKNTTPTSEALRSPNVALSAGVGRNTELDVVHLYDGHERVMGTGSVPNVVWNLAKQTAARGHNVTVIERQWAGLPIEDAHQEVSFHRLDLSTGTNEPWSLIPYEMVSSLTGAVRLLLDRTNFAVRGLQYLRQHDPDIIHVHLPFAANVVATLSRSLASRMVYTAHIGETKKRISHSSFSPDVYLANRAAKTIALNPEARQAFADRGVDNDRLEVVPNGVNHRRFDGTSPGLIAEVREDYGISSDLVVLFVGTITPRKGVTDLVKAAAAVPNEDVQFVLVGETGFEPDYAEEVREIISEESNDSRVTLTGFISEERLHAFFDLADLFVLPSYEEGSSIAVTEAISAGLPVVGSDIHGIKQQVDHGVHGLLAPPGDIEALTENLSQLIGDEAKRASMRTTIEERAEELSWEQITSRVIDVYGSVVEDSSRSKASTVRSYGGGFPTLFL